MKILHILNSLMPSGAETMLVSSSGLWTGCSLHVLATQKELGIYAASMEQAGFRIHHIWEPSFFAKHRKIISLMKKEGFDAVHIHPQSQSVFYALDAKIAGIPSLVRTVHSMFLFTGSLRFRETLFRMAMRWMGVRFAAISDSVAENEWKRFRNKTTVIYNWCSPRFGYISEEAKAAARQAAHIPDSCFVLLSVGNCSRIKNHEMILEAISRLEEKESLLYIHVGDNDAGERKLAEQYGISRYVRFTGPSEPDAYLSMADCYVMPSRTEGLGIAAVEAITCGLPVILTDVPGLREFRKHSFEQVYYIPLSPEALKEQLQKLMEKRPGNSLQQSRQAKECYSAEKSVKMYMALYQMGSGTI